MNDPSVDDILARLARCSEHQRRQVFDSLRSEFSIHTLEKTFGVTAEVILEAIMRASDLTQRGVLGVIAEAEFGTSVAKRLDRWSTAALQGDFLYDYELTDSIGPVRVQVKRQRREAGIPKVDNGMYVVETQKTRGGKTAQDEKTRPYRFGDFDILAVCMEASTKRWSDFMYTVESWLIPQHDDKACLQTFQFIPMSPNSDWTSDFLEAVDWFRSGSLKTIAGRVIKGRTLPTGTKGIVKAGPTRETIKRPLRQPDMLDEGNSELGE